MSDLKAKLCDIASLAHDGSGPRWGEASDDLNATLLSWPEGHGVAWSVNNELDVVIVGVEGEAKACVEDEDFELRVGCALLIPKGAHRSIIAQSERFSYFSIHRRRAGLQIKTD